MLSSYLEYNLQLPPINRKLIGASPPAVVGLPNSSKIEDESTDRKYFK